jgi:hypothetical protein
MRSPTRHPWTCRLGLVLGAALAAVALYGWQVPRGTGSLGADVSLTVNLTGELDVQPFGRVLAASDMRPGRPESGRETRLAIKNQTARRLELRMRARPSIRDLDGLLGVRVSVGERKLFAGRLGGLRRWTRTALQLRSGETRPVTVRIWLPDSVGRDYEGRSDDIVLELDATGEGA